MKKHVLTKAVIISCSALCIVMITAAALYYGTSSSQKSHQSIDISDSAEKINVKPKSSTNINKAKIEPEYFPADDESNNKEIIDLSEVTLAKTQTLNNTHYLTNIKYSNLKQDNYSPIPYAFWRRNVADLDNIYKEPKVAGIRNIYIEKYLKISDLALEQNDWNIRKTYRKAAHKKLEEGISHLENLCQKCRDKAIEIECFLAIAELSYKSQNYDQAIKNCQKVINRIQEPQIASQACYYMIKSSARAGDMENCRKHIDMLLKNFPNEAKVFYGDNKANSQKIYSELEAMLRNQAFCYEKAEGIDDLMLRETKNNDTLRKYRDSCIDMAKKCEDVFLKLDESIQQLHFEVE
jgi:tetratricopeptide (TPR) repeat protein